MKDNGRNLKLFYVFAILFILLAVRIFYIQIYSGKRLSISAAAQKISNQQIQIPRGSILDANLIPLINRTTKVDLVIKPLNLRDSDGDIEKIAQILKINFNELKREIDFKKEPILLEIDEDKRNSLKSENISGISFINSLKRYDDNPLAVHVIGYLNQVDKTGQTGIEKYYEDILKVDGKSSVAVITDARNNLVEGLGYRFMEHENDVDLNVKLTIDYNIQKIAQDVMDKYNLTGAVVIENVVTGDIAAMVSNPDFEPYSIEKYLDSSKKELFNRAVASYSLGSIFKIVDLACAYNNNINPEMYYFCPGYVVLGDKELRCSSYHKGGHGLIALRDAFASSCNPYFIELGIRLGHSNIVKTAQSFGLGTTTGINLQGVEESSGNLPDINKSFTFGDTANLSIGQGDVMASPLQVTDMVATIANGGIKNKINIVDSIVDSNGNTVKKIRTDEGKRIIPKEVCDKIKNLMEEVTVTGTGTRANLDQYGGAGGKTGSAETGQFINGEKIVHAWFAGYFPKLNPKYSITVFIENGQSGGTIAAPVFEEIAKNIMKKNY